MKKFAAGILLVILVLGLCACAESNPNDKGFIIIDPDSVGTNADGTPKITEDEAISKIKTAYDVDQRIARELGFQFFAQPTFGVCSAEKNDDGSWAVSIKGNMNGYIDDYKSEFREYRFEIIGTVKTDGIYSYTVWKR